MDTALSYVAVALMLGSPLVTNEDSRAPEMPIGVACMKEDGTIVMALFTEGPILAHARFIYAPNHPDYERMVTHLKGIKPGEKKPVAPFTDKNKES